MKKNLNDVKHGKRNFGFFLLFIEAIELYGCTLEGNEFPTEFFEAFGFLLPGIIGILLILSDYKQNKKK